MKKWYQYEKVELSLSARYGIYLITYVVFCLLVFSTINSKEIGDTVRETIKDSTYLQAENVNKIIHQQLDKLEMLCDYVEKQDEIISDETLEIAESMAKKTNLTHVFIAGVDGNAYFNDGKRYDISKQSYYTKSLNGEIIIAESTQSVIDDECRVVMSLPIYRDRKIIGVVGGSYDVFSLDRLFFINSEVISESTSFIMNKSGDFVTVNKAGELTVSNDCDMYFDEIDFLQKPFEYVIDKLKDRESYSDRIQIDGVEYFISLNMLEINEWILGYIIPVSTAQSQFEFVYFNEIGLFAFIGIGFVAYLLFILRDFRREQRLLIKQATIDSLTGLLNKKSTEEAIKRELLTDALSALIIIDIDDFKYVNDHCGHDKGDLYLHRISECLRDQFRKDDILGRIGGDEMMVFMSDLTSKEDVCVKVERFLKSVNDLVDEFDQLQKTSCSVGIAFYPQDGKTFETLYSHADEALYQVKKSGKSGYCVYKDE